MKKLVMLALFSGAMAFCYPGMSKSLSLPPIHPTDSLTLLTLYDAFNADEWYEPWDLNEPMWNWNGVGLNYSTGRVTYLWLPNIMSGYLPPEIGNLTELVELALLGGMNGEIPSELGQLTKLKTLHLGATQLSGSIPEEIGNLTELRILRLQNNKLTGSIPSSIGNLDKVRVVTFGTNNLSGEIPEEISNMTDLQYLNLSRNQLTGELPESLGSMPNLVSIRVNENMLSGSIPLSLEDLNLRYLIYYQNQLCLPVEFDLSTVQIHDGTGEYCTFPCAEDKRDALMALYNSTGGANWTVTWDLNLPVHAWHGVVVNNDGCVVGLKLGDNNLVGTIPSEIGELTDLTKLELFKNQLSGTIPSALSNLDNLLFLKLYRNQLSGEIPAELGDLDRLISLSLVKNQLEGNIPAILGELPNLEYLNLHYNQLSGSIPVELGQLTGLIELGISNNNLTGELPESLSNLTSLARLHVEQNNLTGSIPLSYSNIPSIGYFSYEKTNICTPQDEDFLSWLNSFTTIRSGIDCSTPVTEALTSNTVSADAMQVYPNPTAGVANIPFVLTQRSEETNILIYDEVGNEVWNHRGSYGEGYHNVTADLSHLPAGLYIYQLVNAEMNVSKRLVIKR
ncbi:MAG: T9SS type A sorting domain-containing protein [Bacteroidota bacterium]